MQNQLLQNLDDSGPRDDSRLGQIAFWLTIASTGAYVALNQAIPNHASFVLDSARKVAAAIFK